MRFTFKKKKVRFLAVVILFLIACSLYGQTSFVLWDNEKNQPIADALIFIDQSYYHVVSRRNGEVIIDAEVDKEEIFNISHLNYEFKEIPYHTISERDTISLIPLTHQLDNVFVVAKASRKRKRWLRQFEADFLGINHKRFKAKIQNPEVLLFKEDGNDLFASSDQPLVIKNEALQYEIMYWLQEYRRDKEGTISYHGKYFISDLVKSLDEKVEERRREVYENSLEYLLMGLVDNSHDKNFTITLGRLAQDGTVELLRGFTPRKHLNTGTEGEIFELRFRGILHIQHKTLTSKDRRNNLRDFRGLGRRAEHDMIQQESNASIGSTPYETSYLFSQSGQILFNRQGTILNSQDIKTYGYWGTLGMADVLPAYDYSQKHTSTSGNGDLLLFLDLLEGSEADRKSSLEYLSDHWKPSYLPPAVDLMFISGDPLRSDLGVVLSKHTKQRFGVDYYRWLSYLWKKEFAYEPFYTDFKAVLYSHIDPRFRNYFEGRYDQSIIRFDEIVWGGVRQDGIPPLRYPEMIPADDADYLEEDHLVFGISIGGESRAYPKRILGWHEMVVDNIAGHSIAGVYCTLCGTMIAYDQNHQGTLHELGTSGFLYRSNKLMYDKKTQSLWSTIDGQPVVGPLVGRGIQLKTYPVVTVTWGAWKKAHPETLVLSLNTGHRRDYREGAAYREYYATDNLMFPVPRSDDRLNNKSEVFVIRDGEYRNDPIAFSIDFLVKRPLYSAKIGNQEYVLITNRNGGTRAYINSEVSFRSYQDGVLKDDKGRVWEVSEESLRFNTTELKRIAGHRIFWFAWYNAYPDTRLIK